MMRTYHVVTHANQFLKLKVILKFLKYSEVFLSLLQSYSGQSRITNSLQTFTVC